MLCKEESCTPLCCFHSNYTIKFQLYPWEMLVNSTVKNDVIHVYIYT